MDLLSIAYSMSCFGAAWYFGSSLEFPWSLAATPMLSAGCWFAYEGFYAVGARSKDTPSPWACMLGGVCWDDEAFCRGWDISGKTGSGKTSSGVVPLIYSLKQNCPNVGIVVLDTKGDLTDPLVAIAKELDCTKDLRVLQVRADGALSNWTPPLTMKFLTDRSVPYSTYAKLLVDIATAAGQKGGQEFFKTAAGVAKIESQLRSVFDFELIVVARCLKVPIEELAPSKKTWIPGSLL